MKRVAVCLSGHMRLYKPFFDHFKKEFMNKNKNYKFDFFIDTWDKNNFYDDKWQSDIIEEDIKSVFGNDLKRLIIENNDNMLSSDSYKDIIDKYKIDHKGDGSHIINMFYKIYKCNQLKKKYEEENNFIYDVVIRHRSDYFINGNIIFDDLDMNKMNIINCSIVLPHNPYNFYGINDLFAMSSSKNIDIYSNLYLDFQNHIEKYKCISEGLITYYLEENGFILYPEMKNMNLINVENSYVYRMNELIEYLWNGYVIMKKIFRHI